MPPSRLATVALASLLLLLGRPALARAQAVASPHDVALEVVTVDDSPGACPTAAQVTEALNARIPGVVLNGAGSAPDGPRPVRLALTHSGPGAVRIELLDPRGVVALERTLRMLVPEPAPGHRAERPSTSGCAALADTVSLIVDRYLRHVGNREDVVLVDPTPPVARLTAEPAPPPAPPPAARGGGMRAVLLGVGGDVSRAARQPDGATQWTEFVSLSLGLHWRRAVISLGAGVGSSTRSPVIPEAQDASFRYLPVPLRVAAGVRIPVGGLVLIPQAGTGADLLFTSSQGIQGARFDVTAEPVLEAGGECLFPLGGRAFLNAHLWGVMNLRPHDFALAAVSRPVLGTPRLYARGGLQLGFVFDAGASRWNR